VFVTSAESIIRANNVRCNAQRCKTKSRRTQAEDATLPALLSLALVYNPEQSLPDFSVKAKTDEDIYLFSYVEGRISGFPAIRRSSDRRNDHCRTTDLDSVRDERMIQVIRVHYAFPHEGSVLPDG
jgi:hypothetical protein